MDVVTSTPTNSSSSASRASCPRLVCSCGTCILFYGNLEKRTCWKCGASFCRSVAQSAPHASMHHAVAPEPAKKEQKLDEQNVRRRHASTDSTPQRVEMSSEQGSPNVLLRAKTWHPSTQEETERHELLNAKEVDEKTSAVDGLFRMEDIVHSIVKTRAKERAESETRQHFFRNALLLTIVLNVFVFIWQMRAWQNAVGESRNLVDFDGDGVPDHQDKCPSSSGTGWISGPANDRDSDGCADHDDDDDDDNDGILDLHDKCPFTPQGHGYKANVNHDFDMDGCVDHTEDKDDDNDGVHDDHDKCPHTTHGEQSDHEGCTRSQRNNLPNASEPPIHALEPKEEDDTSEWYDTVLNVFLQFVLGLVFSEIWLKSEQYREAICAAAADPSDAVRRTTSTIRGVKETSKSILNRHAIIIRIICYSAVLLYFYHTQYHLHIFGASHR